MTTPPSLPSLPGLSWSRHKAPKFNTRVAPHVSGREVRVALMAYPLYEFEAAYGGGLISAASPAAAQAGLGAQSLQSLMGFFLQLQGQFGTFLYTDPDDNTVTGQAVGTGDGVTTTFAVARTLGGFTEPVGWVTQLSAVYFNGVVIPSSAYTLIGNALIFSVPPPAGATLTADFAFAFNCRFTDDQMDFEEFMSGLWKLDSMKFRSVKVPAFTNPSWLPQPGGVTPILYADFVAGNYWYNGATYASFSAWLAAQSGSFARTNAALYTGSNGLLLSAAAGVPRFDYDPVTLKPLGLLLETLFSNYFLYTQLFSNAVWTKTNVAVTDASGTAPDGTNTAELLTESGSGSIAHEVTQSVTGSGAARTVLVHARAGTGNYLNIAMNTGHSGDWAQAIFDLSQGGVTEAGVGSYNSTATISIAQTTIEPAPDFGAGWYRCIFRASFQSSPTAVTFHFGIAAAAHNNSYSSTNGAELHVSAGKTLYLWGAQTDVSTGLPYSYAANGGTSGGVNGGGDQLSLGVNWDTGGSITYLQEHDLRIPGAPGTIVSANGSYGSSQDSWTLQTDGISAVAVQEPSGNQAQTITGIIPGVNRDAIRIDSTTVTLSDNGNAAVTSAAGTARTAMIKLSPGAYEGNAPGMAIRLRKIAAWTSGLTNTQLQALSAAPGTPAPVLASTVRSGDPNWIGYPGLCVLPSGYLCVVYVRFNSASQGALPSQIMYTTAPATAGPWSAPAVAVANSNGAVSLQNCALTALPGGTILAMINYQNNTAPYTTAKGSLQVATATETSPGVLSWGTAATIDSSPFFTGTNSGGTEAGDFCTHSPILLPNGKWMQTIYGYLSGATTTSTGVIFSTTPTVAASWGGFTVIANGSNYVGTLAFSEAGAFVDASGNIVVILREDAAQVPGGVPGYWRVMCPAGADPTVASNWNAPTRLFDAILGTVGKPDAIALPGNGMWMMGRVSQQVGSLVCDVAYVTNWNAAKSPFPAQMAGFDVPAFGAGYFWYSQSQLIASQQAAGANVVSTVAAAFGTDTPVQISLATAQIFGEGQSQ